MSTQPVTFTADFVAERSRLTTFFRLILVIPQIIVVALYGIAAFFAIVAAWFALVFTGRWPRALFDFVAGFFRWSTRVQGYLHLLADPYPPFSADEHAEYPVVLVIGPPKDSYSRVRVLLRIFMAIPIYIVAYLLSIVSQTVGFLSWLVIVVTGRQVEALHNVLLFSIGYQVRAYAFMALLYEEWPSFSNEPEEELAPVAFEPPAAPEAPERPV